MELNCLTVTILNDTRYEDNEQFLVTVSINDTISLPTPFLVEESVAVVILDNDGMYLFIVSYVTKIKRVCIEIVGEKL